MAGGENLARARGEEQRVAEMLRRDAQERLEEALRQDAQRRVENGDPGSLADAAVPPTPEWKRQGGFVETTAGREHWTDQTVTTVKRVQSRAKIEQLHMNGDLDDRQFASCRWYRSKWTLASMFQGPSIAAYNSDPRGEKIYGHLPRSAVGAECRSDLRRAQAALPPATNLLFDLIVIEDMGIDEAGQRCRMGHRRAKLQFLTAAAALSAFLDGYLPDKLQQRTDDARLKNGA
jgi:hypothetical protein